MATNATIKYYPVGNGDMSLITLEDKTTILTDCNIRNCDSDEVYDAKADLMQSVKFDNGIPYIDVFILTHGDQDHCRGFKKHFYQGAPENYSEADKKEELIRVDTMWFSPMIAEEHAHEDEDTYQREAERRLALHRKNDPKKDNPGNRVKIIGYDGNEDYQDLNYLRAVPGEIVTRFNDKEQALFSVFIHAPFKEHLEAMGDDKKNSTSIVFQARFKNNPYQSEFSALAMFGGDSDHTSWCIILDKTKRHNNEHALKWDLFLSPHHCSWSFFNDRPQADHPVPKQTSLAVLDYKRANAKVIASCKKISAFDKNPPHYAAKKEYVKKVTESNFHNTTIYNVENNTPQPIIYEVTQQGIVKHKKVEGSARVAGGAALGAINTPSTYGNGEV
tara:strand:+ start:9591 stop:10757 length:1167 start_codon:yes stop_codon:yes gene_type:complete